MKLLVVDGNSIVNRAFYGIKLLTTRTGQYTNAITGFMNILLKLQSEQKPDEIAVAFDLKAPTFRHKMFDGYKAQRKGMPEELASQMPLLKELLSALGYKMVTCEGFEADDILGTLAHACAQRGDTCLLATGDRDSLQLISDKTTVLLAGSSLGKSVTTAMDFAAVSDKYGVSPAQLIDVKSLMGDASDNIPGVAGIGEKTALALIQAFGSLAGVYENLDDARVKPGVREKLLRDKAQAQMSRTLAEIVRDAPVDTAPGAYAQGASDGAAAAKLMSRLEMYGLVKKLGLDDAAGTRNFAGGAAAADGSAGAKSVSGKGSAAAKRRAAQADPDNGQLSFDDAFGTPVSEPGTSSESANGTGGSDGAAGADKAPASERQDTNALAFAVPADTAQPDTVPLPALSGPVYLCTPDAVSSADESELLADGATILIVQNDAVYTAGISSEALLSLLENENAEKRCFNAKPLYRAAFAAHRTVQNLTFDAKLAAYLLQPDARSYTVTRLAESYGVAPAFASPYAQAGVLAALCDTLARECDDAGMGNLLREIELPLCEVLASMEHEGILVDKAGIEAFGKELQSALTAELAAICEGVGYEFNVNSPKQLGKALFEDLGLPTRKKTKSGYSTNAETLESLREYSPIIDHILQYRTYQKLNSTYVEGLLKVIGADGRIHSTFNQTETRTGRISSGEPNLQNIPVRTELGSRFRKYFVAPGGCTLLDADYSQIELRILAHIADDAVMQETFRAGDDIHRSTAAKIYGVSETDVTPQMRSSAKAVNFGIVYGIGAFSLAKDINVSVKDADAFIKSYLSKFPNVKRYMDDTVATARENGCVTTLYGRRRMLPELANSNFNIRALGERMAMNTPIQGTAADIIKLAMVRVYRRLAAENLNAKLILQVHDELIVECPQSERARAAAILGEEMQGAAQLRVPLVADVNSGDSWYDAKG